MENLIALYDISIDVLTSNFNKIGLDILGIETPITITELRTKAGFENNTSFDIEDLDDKSLIKINSFLQNAKADCGYVMGKFINSVHYGQNRYFSHILVSLTIMPCKLIKKSTTI